jgi:hypothetical protein
MPTRHREAISEAFLEAGRKLFPRRYRRNRNVSALNEASEWARTLDWQDNPYDRFLFQRELMRQAENLYSYDGWINLFSFCSRQEVATEIEELLLEFKNEYGATRPFDYVLSVLPWRLGLKHGFVKHSKLEQALSSMPR